MPRRARILIPGVPHHLTQRGNYRKAVFFGSTDQMAYLRLLKVHADRNLVEIVAYCLMPNHVHLVAVPQDSEGVHRMLGAVHGQYSQRVNRMRKLTGHCWQSRYFSSPLDESYFQNAIRYVELNPVRAGLVGKAEDFEWSSAAAHCGARRDPLIGPCTRWRSLAAIASWSRWLAEGIADDLLDTLRKQGSQNLPCGSESFLSELESGVGRSLRYRRVGREPEQK